MRCGHVAVPDKHNGTTLSLRVSAAEDGQKGDLWSIQDELAGGTLGTHGGGQAGTRGQARPRELV